MGEQNTSYAIIEESGGQRIVTAGEVILVDLIDAGERKVGDTLTYDKVLVIGQTGGSAKVGTPYVSGAAVLAEVTEPEVLGDKLYIHKFRSKKGYKRKTGHRQRYTEVRITALNA